MHTLRSMLLKAYWLVLVIMFSGALKALLRMVANHSSVLSAGWSSNARATGRDTWSSTQAWKATSAPCVPFVVLVKTISSPTWRWDDLDSLRVKCTLMLYSPQIRRCSKYAAFPIYFQWGSNKDAAFCSERSRDQINHSLHHTAAANHVFQPSKMKANKKTIIPVPVLVWMQPLSPTELCDLYLSS